MKNDPLYAYMYMYHDKMIEDDKLKSHDTAIITIPQEAPEGSILRTESAMDLLERINKFNLEWVKAGHNKGDNTNNVSATVSIDKSRIYVDPPLSKMDYENRSDEWQMVGRWMWNNRNYYNGISVLPYDNGSYIQAPFENCTKEQFLELSKNLNEIDLTKVIEDDDNVNFTENLACGPDGCEVK